MKLRDGMLGLAIAVAGLAGCAVCDTCDDFPAPCIGPNCGQNGMVGAMTGGPGDGPAVMGSATPTYGPMNDEAGPGPMMPPAATMPATPAVDPATPPAAMEPAPR